MSIIFQLFSAEDLQKLTDQELDKLRDAIIDALKEGGLFKDGKLHLNLEPKVKPDGTSPFDPNSTPEWVQKALLKRFNEVAHQLQTPQLSQPQNLFDFEELIKKRNSTETQEVQKKILNWAISCELNHIEFYYALLKAREGVNKFYEENPDAKAKLLTKVQQQQTKYETPQEVRTKEPDSAYSPFNPRHPLYRQYDDVSKSAPGTTGPTPPSGS
jgi:hypothetical protein